MKWGAINWTLNLQSGTGDFLVLNSPPATGIDIVVGATGIDLNNESDLDATISGIEEVDITGSADDDTVSGAGSTATGAAATADIVFTGSDGRLLDKSC